MNMNSWLEIRSEQAPSLCAGPEFVETNFLVGADEFNKWAFDVRQRRGRISSVLRENFRFRIIGDFGERGCNAGWQRRVSSLFNKGGSRLIQSAPDGNGEP